MINYIRSEIFRIFRQPIQYLFLGFILLAILFLALVERQYEDMNSGLFLINYSYLFLIVGIAFPIYYTELNRKDPSLYRQIISFGRKRMSLFLSDLNIINNSVFALVLLTSIFTLVLSLLLFPRGEGFLLHLKEYAQTIALSYLLFLPLVAMAVFLHDVFNNLGVVVTTYLVLTLLLPLLALLLVDNAFFSFLSRMMPTSYFMRNYYLLGTPWYFLCLISNTVFWLAAAGFVQHYREL